MPNFPSISPEITRESALTMILASIAMEELGISHIINAEGEKIQYVLNELAVNTGTGATLDDILSVNKSVESLLDVLMQSQMFLKNKMEKVLEVMAEELGPTGPIGPQGRVGATGATGPKGDTGPEGGIGRVGLPGPPGATGNTGAIGATGPMGPMGIQGLQGDTGPVGPVGVTGATGATGIQGPKGNTGPAGPVGAQGPKGPKGATGPMGPPGHSMNCVASFSDSDNNYLWECDTPFPWKDNFIEGDCICCDCSNIILAPCKYYSISFTINVLTVNANPNESLNNTPPNTFNRGSARNYNANAINTIRNISIKLMAEYQNQESEIFTFYQPVFQAPNSPFSITSGSILFYAPCECVEGIGISIRLTSPFSITTGASLLSIVEC
jgi:hypothetical protein